MIYITVFKRCSFERESNGYMGQILYMMRNRNLDYILPLIVVIYTTRVQILDETDCISHSTNTLGKGMNPTIFSPAMGK